MLVAVNLAAIRLASRLAGRTGTAPRVDGLVVVRPHDSLRFAVCSADLRALVIIASCVADSSPLRAVSLLGLLGLNHLLDAALVAGLRLRLLLNRAVCDAQIIACHVREGLNVASKLFLVTLNGRRSCCGRRLLRGLV